MTIRKQPGKNYLAWYYDIEAKGRARKRAARPKRDILMVQTGLKNLKLRYCQEVSFWSPHHKGRRGNLDGGLLWVDFVVRKKKRPVVVILDDPKKRWKSYEKEYARAKSKELNGRGIVTIWLPAGKTSQEYQIMIYRDMKKKGVW